MKDLARRAVAVTQKMFELGNERFEAEGALFVRNRSMPALHEANHVSRVSAATPQAIGRLLARAEREFAGLPHLRFDLDADTPTAFEARLALEGYDPNPMLVMALEGPLQGRPPKDAFDIRLVEGDSGWADYEALHDVDWHAYAEGDGSPAGKWTADEMLRGRRSKSPPMRYWLAYVDGSPRAYASSWEGVDGVGTAEDLYTHPDARHRGLATALIHRCVDDARERGAGPIVIVAGPDDTPKNMYVALGFRPVAVTRHYWKFVG